MTDVEGPPPPAPSGPGATGSGAGHGPRRGTPSETVGGARRGTPTATAGEDAGGAAVGPERTGRAPTVAAAVTLGALLLGVGALIGWTTPWSPLGAAVPGGAVPVDPARDFTPAERAREHAFHSAVHPPAYLSLGVALLVAALLAVTPLGARLVGSVTSGWAHRRRGRWTASVVAGVLAVVVVQRVATLPFDAWAQAVDRRYGLSTQGWPSWLADQGKGAALTAALAVPVLLAALAVARRLPRWWWAPTAAGAGLLVFALSFAYPLVVEPVFSSFHPLPAGPLRASLLDLARRDGVPVDQVLVADASRRTTTLNAYVSGFGASRRIVLYDTLLSQPPGEIRLVVAHELGHVKRGDVLHGTAEGALGLAAGVCGLFLLTGARPVLRRAGVPAVTDPRAVALVLGLVGWLSFAASPVQDLVSRHIEARADVHSLDLTGDPVTFVRAHRALAVRGLSTLRPNPIPYALFFDHPTEPQRIGLARDWARIHRVPEPPSLVRGSGR